jgi:hypothetical protein
MVALLLPKDSKQAYLFIKDTLDRDTNKLKSGVFLDYSLSLLSKAKFRKSFGVGLVIKDKYGVY